MRRWDDLTEEEQLRLREAYQHHLESRPPGCAIGSKAEAFAEWLAERGVEFDVEGFLAGRSGRAPRR
jgi:hypothetical protein